MKNTQRFIRLTIKLLEAGCLWNFTSFFINSLPEKSRYYSLRIIGNVIEYIKSSKMFDILKIKPTIFFEGYIVKKVQSANYQKMRLPDVHNLLKDNSLNCYFHDINIYKFSKSLITSQSDVIRFKNCVFWQKIENRASAQNIPIDDNCIYYSHTNENIYLLNYDESISIDSGFNLCGVHINAWGHFLLSYIPKVYALINSKDLIPINTPVLVPEDIHAQEKEILKTLLEGHFPILYVKKDLNIFCKTLYHCSSIGYLSDHGFFTHPTDMTIPDYTGKALSWASKLLKANTPKTSGRKIYIARGPNRNLINAFEVEAYFKENGFQFIHPHLLSLSEKIEVFANATHIAGPISSGFTNFIFCNPGVKILGFFNFARCYDPLVSAVNESGQFNCQLYVLTGSEEPSGNPNNSFHIPLPAITEFIGEINFFE